ncbi:MAG: hypothetical protein EA339_00125 [Rhodobacteraceae bacterium]|nr:MAG: hypothetical protein EA339_00125 [Paracoccaceae bacterium]
MTTFGIVADKNSSVHLEDCYIEADIPIALSNDSVATSRRNVFRGRKAGVKVSSGSKFYDVGSDIKVAEIERITGLQVPLEMQKAASEALLEVKQASSKEDATEKLSRSGFGRWLKEQRGVEWLAIVSNLAIAFWDNR